jgi:hypothetical protein
MDIGRGEAHDRAAFSGPRGAGSVDGAPRVGRAALMRTVRVRFRIVALLAACALVTPAVPTAPAQARSADRPRPEVRSISDDARSKIHPKLQRAIDRAAPGAELRFVARIVEGTSLDRYTERWFARPWVDPMGTTVAAGVAKPSALLKLAGLPGVVSLQLPESLVAPPKPTPNHRPRPAAPGPRIVRDGGSGPAPTGWFHTGSAIHGSQDAWAKGYTGDGVRYMSNDSGADYCHPDLFGTWAYIDDPSSNYYGLPEMFDSLSSFVAANDFYLGTGFIAAGFADYADTSTTATFAPGKPGTRQAVYRPIGAVAQRTFKLPSTSKSGEYHIGSHPDTSLAEVAPIISQAFFKGAAKARQGERAGVLVVDEHVAGVYDTVYVDLNYDFDFRNDTPARLTRDFTSQEAACLDYDADGLNDISGGLAYFVSDGSTPVPTHDWLWGIPGSFFGNGDLVAFHVQDFVEGSNHGQGTTSVATGQGIVAGNIFFGPDGPPVAEGRGLVVGPGKDVRSTQNGNFYSSPFIEDPFIFASLGYDGSPGTGDDIQIVSNSWAFSDIDNDGLDFFSRLIDLIHVELGPHTTSLFANGNGGPGYGTELSASPASGVGVAAADLNDTHGLYFPDITEEQIVGGDVTSFSNRGPTPRNIAGTDVTAVGAFGTSDLSLNETLWGAVATALFGGTSMATPVAAGNLALIYDAWRERLGSWPTFEQARAVLMGSARDVSNDVFSQGAGLVNADIGTDLAAGLDGAFATPTAWSAGDYRGTDYPMFVHVLGRGESDSQTFTLRNNSADPVTVDLSTTRYTRIGSDDYSFTTLPSSQDHGAFPVPDYLIRLDQAIPAGTDLVQVRVARPYDQFDPDGDVQPPFDFWELDLEDWTDRDGDGRMWDDADGDGKVDVGETDLGEYVSFTFHGGVGPTLSARVGNPLGRMADGLFIALYHFGRAPGVTATNFTIEATYWQQTDWGWLSLSSPTATVPAGGTASFGATLTVPGDAAHGAYEGAIQVADGDRVQTIPVSVAVAGDGTDLAMGGIGRQDELYDNGRLFGLTDAFWRPETGDWRIFWTDINAADLPTSGTPHLLVDTTWDQAGSDIDTIVLGPTEDCFSNGVGCEGGLTGFPGNSARYGPYALDTVARSVDTNQGDGRWLFQTSSGGPAERVTAPAREGLHEILLHHVVVAGGQIDEPFNGQIGFVSIDPGAIVAPPATSPTNVTLSTEIALDGLVADGFGLSQPVTTRETVFQDDPNDPSTASFSRTVNISHGAMLDVSTANSGNGSDIDLYVYGPDGSLLGASFTPTDVERVSVVFPVDGTYRIDVHGWNVPSGSDQFDLTIDAVQGSEVTVSGLVGSLPAGGSDTFSVAWDVTGKAAGTYNGFVLLGPSGAPAALRIPVEVTVQ